MEIPTLVEEVRACYAQPGTLFNHSYSVFGTLRRYLTATEFRVWYKQSVAIRDFRYSRKRDRGRAYRRLDLRTAQAHDEAQK